MRTLPLLGAVLALGFIAASGYVNYVFAGAIGLLAVGVNSLAPFWLASAAQRSLRFSIIVLWAVCLTYSFTAAIGYAATTRQHAAGTQTALHENLKTETQTLKDLEAKTPRNAATERQILAQRDKIIGMRTRGAMNDAEPHVHLFSTLTRFDRETVRLVLLALLGTMIELGSAVTLFAAIGHFQKPRPPQPTQPRATLERETEY